MALDGIFLYSLVDELKKNLLNGKVEKVNQPEKDEIILSIKNNRKTYKLSISSSSVYPKIHITTISKPNPMQPPMFCMVLRKYLNSGKLINIRQLDTDRIIFLDFESSDELGFNSIYTLVIEIMGRHSNITLVRERDNIIMDSIKHITLEINSIRCLYPGVKYVLPPNSPKLNPLDFDFETFKNFIKENYIEFDNKFFSRTFTGVSTSFSKALVFKFTSSENDFSFNNIEAIFNFCNETFNSIKNGDFNFVSYAKEGKVKDFYCKSLNFLESFDEKSYSSASELLQEFYAEKDKADRLNNRSSDLQKLINVHIERCLKKINILKENLKECENKDKYKIYGELLTANIYSLKKGDKIAHLQNYYTEDMEYIDISIDPNKTPSENIQRYYKKYNKLKKTEEAANIQLEIANEELDYLNSVFTNIKNAEDYVSIEEIKHELMETGYIKFKKSSNKKEKPSKPMKFISSDGDEIYVGKNNFQNDYITIKLSNKNDIWLHTKDIPGSHVVIKNTGNISDTTLEQAAMLAAYYSKAKESSKVAVDYTEIRNVHKPNGAKPGRVIYYTNKTIFVKPMKPDIQEIS